MFFSSYRFEIEIEPIFASLALYDVKEKKKVRFWDLLTVIVIIISFRNLFTCFLFYKINKVVIPHILLTEQVNRNLPFRD